ncbi:MAG: type VI secretion protein IcmF/TssM N-terminal domain-containing protein [Planctomycetota bacterium]
MFSLLKGSLKQVLAALLAVVAPAVALRRADSTPKRWFVVGVHVGAMILALITLSIIQVFFQLDTFVRSSLPLIRYSWLPLVGLLSYGTAWSAWFVAGALRMQDEKPLIGTVAASLRSGLRRCSQAGINIVETPVYLVLGSPEGDIRDFFTSSHTDLVVLPSAEEANDAIQVCGDCNAIYICCREASLLGDYTRRAAEARAVSHRSIHSDTKTIAREPAHAWASSHGYGANEKQSVAKASIGSMDDSVAACAVAAPPVPANAATPLQAVVADDETTKRVHDTIHQIESLAQADTASVEPAVTVLQPQQSTPPVLRLEAAEADELLGRLEALCHELGELRQPYCPINGVLLMVPLDATDHLETADHVGMRMERDLATITRATETSVSAQLIFCDLESCEGADAFLERFPDEQRHRRLGAVLPAPPESEQEAGPKGIELATQWICQQLLPPLGYRLLKRDLKSPANDRSLRQGNDRIVRLVAGMRERQQGMSRMLRRAITSTGNLVRLRGCFLAATGARGLGKQAFCAGVIPLILDIQNEVQWSPDRRGRDRGQRRCAWLVYAAVAITAVGTLAVLFGWHLDVPWQVTTS